MNGVYLAGAGIIAMIALLWVLGLVGKSTHRDTQRTKILHHAIVRAEHSQASTQHDEAPPSWGPPVPVVPNSIINVRYPQMNG